MSHPILRDEGLNRQFEINGSVTIPLLSETELEEIRSRFSRLKPDDGFKPAGNRYHVTFLDTNTQYKRDCFAIFRDLLVPKLDHILFDYELLVGNFFVKNPGGTGELPVHQNHDTVDETKYTSVTVWIPLNDTNKENGTIELVHKSHKIFPDIASRNADYYFTNFIGEIKAKYCQPCNVKAGHALIFDDDLIHYSTTNDSAQPRVAMQLVFIPKCAQAVINYLDPAAPGKGFEVFEANAEFFLTNHTCVQRPSSLKFLRRVPNNNRLVTEAEFVDRLARGDEIRKAFYAGSEEYALLTQPAKQFISKSAPPKQPWWQRLFMLSTSN